MRGVFGEYAGCYDLFNQDKDYERETDYILQLAESRMPGGSYRNLLELGCGTGGHARPLARRGCKVTGIDRSATMLAVARDKDEEGSPVTYIENDITALRLDKRFDLIVSLFHVMSYQVRDEDLDKAFATAAVHLRTGGLFIFDYWYGPAVLHLKPGPRVKEIETAESLIRRTANPVLRPEDHTVHVNYTVEVVARADDEIKQRLQETHVMRYLFRPEIESLLARHGFSNFYSEEWLTGRSPGPDTWGVCHVASRM